MQKKQRNDKTKLKPGDRGSNTPHPIDIHVGERLKSRRIEMGFSQSTLGSEVGLTFQQIQKYERGANRVSASKLFLFAKLFNTDVNYFFQNIPPEILEEMGLTAETVYDNNTEQKEVPDAA